MPEEVLLDSKAWEVLANITRLAGTTNTAAQLIASYESNLHRMGYKRFRQIGCGLIG